MSKTIDPGTPIIDIKCGWCGGTMTAIAGARPGDPLKAKCFNIIEDGKTCGSWTTAGRNPSWALKQQFIKSSEVQDHDHEEATSDTDAESTEGQIEVEQQEVISEGPSAIGPDEGTSAAAAAPSERTGEHKNAGARIKTGQRSGFFKR